METLSIKEHDIELLGTASMFRLDQANRWKPYLQQRSDLVYETSSQILERRELFTPKEHLENIRLILNPPISELAILFNVSRQAIYKWLSEETFPEDENYKLIRTLSAIADQFKAKSFKRTNNLLYLKNQEGLSLFDILKAKLPYEEQVALIIAETDSRELAYKRSHISQSSTIQTDDWMHTIVFPIHPEHL